MFIRTIIIEDEEIARSMMMNRVADDPYLKFLGAFDTTEKALAFVQANEVDLILLDIGMPDSSGFEFLRRAAVRAEVVVVSGDSGHAVDAFEFDVAQYLVKPVTTDSFKHAIDRVRARIASRGQQAINNHIYVKGDNGYVRLNYDELLYVESQRDYALFQTKTDRIVIRGKMKDIQLALSNHAQFFRCHRSFIVNLNEVSRFNATEVIVADREIPLSGGHYSDLQRALNVL